MADTEQPPDDPKGPGDKGGKPNTDDKRRAEEADRKQDQRRSRARPFVRLGMIVVLVGLIAGGLYYWQSTKDIASTDDAYTDGRAVPLAPAPRLV